MLKYTEKDLSLNQAQLRVLCDENNIAWEEKMSKAQLKALLLTVVVPDTEDSHEDTKDTEINQTTESTEEHEEQAPIQSEISKDETTESTEEHEEEQAPIQFPEEEVQSDSSTVLLAMQQEIARRQSRYGHSTQVEGRATSDAIHMEIAKRQSRYGGPATDPVNPTVALQQEIARRQSRFGK